MDEFMGIAIVGAALSLGIQWLKKKYGATSRETKLIAIVGSLMVGSVFWYFSHSVYYETVLGVLGAASTVYALFFKSPKSNLG